MSESAFDDPADAVTTPANTPPGVPERTERTIDAEELLCLLSDEYARSILRTIGDDGLPARRIAERLDLSRATVYRRLNRLEDAGMVETAMAYHSEGHHRKHYRAALDEVLLSFDGGDVVVEDAA